MLDAEEDIAADEEFVNKHQLIKRDNKKAGHAELPVFVLSARTAGGRGYS